MTTIDEKETLEIEKLKLEVSKLLQTDFKLENKKHLNDTVKVLLLTVAVTTAVVTAYFKIQIGM
ncbi:MAG: hypothetical protein GQ570_01560 [Helicobacteraceae bacterium]|nr:hypothetical protein [Helicobacteraceae bacterium]